MRKYIFNKFTFICILICTGTLLKWLYEGQEGQVDMLLKPKKIVIKMNPTKEYALG